jgi:hypothetical protein
MMMSCQWAAVPKKADDKKDGKGDGKDKSKRTDAK